MWRNTRRGKRSVQATSSTKSFSIRSMPGIPKANFRSVLRVSGIKLPGLNKGLSIYRIMRRLTR